MLIPEDQDEICIKSRARLELKQESVIQTLEVHFDVGQYVQLPDH